MHGPRIESTLKEQTQLLEKLFAQGLKPNELKQRLRRGKAYRLHAHSCNHGGNKGRAARRIPGWKKHSKGPQNVPC